MPWARRRPRMPTTTTTTPSSTSSSTGRTATPTQRRMPASWRRFAERPKRVPGLSMPGPWSSIRPYALHILRYEHKALRRMLRDLERAGTGAQRTSYRDRCEAELALYTRVGAEVFYPALRAACRTQAQRKACHEAAQLLRAVELHLDGLRGAAPESARFAGRARALRLACSQFFREERDRIFPVARKVLGRDNLKALGRSMQDHRYALIRNPELPPRLSAYRSG